jgi:phenylalanyl-tRNA synthetase beta chain
MKISLQWLNEYLDTPVAAEQAEQLLTDQGLPIEQTEPFGDDLMLDVEVTSNRSDCLSHVGMAREIAAGGGLTLRLPDCSLPEANGEPVTALTSVDNQGPDSCSVYTARVIRGVKVAPSPDWLVRHIACIGMRSINNVVDATNFVMMELGQPLHAFDLARLEQRRIVVRSAQPGEQFVAIDGTRHKLTANMLLIVDAQRPVAVGGVMGGLNSEVGDDAVDILLEAAMFAPLSIRRTSRKLKLASDSSYRFERGVDPRGVETASCRAARLIVELAGGTLAPGVIRAGADAAAQRSVNMRTARCNSLLGLDLSAEQMAQWLSRLGLAPECDDQAGLITCSIPTFRLDLKREVDLIEEVARMHGLDDVPIQEKIHIQAKAPPALQAARQELGGVLVGHGYYETINPIFVSLRHGKAFLPAECTPTVLSGEHQKNEPMLRPSLVPSLMICRKANQDVGNTNAQLYEHASVWWVSDQEVIEESHLALLRDAADVQEALRDLRGSIEELAERLLGAQRVSFTPTDAEGYSYAAKISCDAMDLGVIGMVDVKRQDMFDLQTPVVIAELDATALLSKYPPSRQVGRLARFPGIERDLSLIVDEKVAWSQIESTLRSSEPALLEGLTFLGTYRGTPIPAGRKSVSLRMLFRDPQGTLRHEQVDPQVAAVVEQLCATVGAELRA